ncbi:MAG TPA: OmpA family protein [Gemmatimonadaceae bacterium]|nr:OmpA family protein [Gemmatimonadaceae bacterium]
MIASTPYPAFVAATALVAFASAATAQRAEIPQTQGVALVQTMHDGDADRESVVTLAEVSSRGVLYEWSLVEVHSARDTIRAKEKRFVSTSDLTGAPQWREYFEKGDALEQPGYTAWTTSAAVLNQLRTIGSSPFSILTKQNVGGMSFGRAQAAAVRWRGKLNRIGAGTEPFPILINEQRVQVPAVHARGEFSGRGQQWSPDIWILADPSHPLILKVASDGRVFQTTKVVLATAGTAVESTLLRACRAEVPGVYFEFNSASLDLASDKTIASLASILSRHPTWQVTIEGHTDSIGSARSNQLLSERRAQAVRESLVTHHSIAAARIRAAGYGATKPLETNTTIEGRARNRRVEILRSCGGSTG